MGYLYNDLTEKIILAYYRVYDFFKEHPGYDQDNLRDALKLELEKTTLNVVCEMSVQREYGGKVIGSGRIDLVVDGKIAVLLKLTAKIDRDAVEQLDTYLSDANLAVGLILRFHRSGAEIKRRFNRAAAPNEE